MPQRDRQLLARLGQLPLVRQNARRSDARRESRGVARASLAVGAERLVLAAEIVEHVSEPLVRHRALRIEPGRLSILGGRFLALAVVHQHVAAREMRRGGVAGASGAGEQRDGGKSEHRVRAV